MEPFTIELEADAGTPRLARREVAARLGGHPRLDDLLLCVSEVVTNAVLHARSPRSMFVHIEGLRLVVEVEDGDSTPPSRRDHDLTAPTGRGLRILDDLTSSWGTRPLPDGKVVWFQFDLVGSGNGTVPAGFRRVRILDLPLDLYRQTSEHGEGLRRELAFVENVADPQGAPVRLYLLGRRLAARYGGLTVAQDAQVNEALASGAAAVDLTYDLPIELAEGCQQLDALFDELDDFCRDGDLLTLVTPPLLLAYRHWFMRELIEQLRDGRAPRPWVAPADLVAPPAPPPPDERPSECTIEVTEDLDLALAPSLREEIVEQVEAGTLRIALDLSRCEFLDSTGLSLLVTTHRRLATDGGGLRLLGAHGQVANVLEMSGVTDLLVEETIG